MHLLWTNGVRSCPVPTPIRPPQRSPLHPAAQSQPEHPRFLPQNRRRKNIHHPDKPRHKGRRRGVINLRGRSDLLDPPPLTTAILSDIGKASS